jgi:hypothetical protein
VYSPQVGVHLAKVSVFILLLMVGIVVRVIEDWRLFKLLYNDVRGVTGVQRTVLAFRPLIQVYLSNVTNNI